MSGMNDHRFSTGVLRRVKVQDFWMNHQNEYQFFDCVPDTRNVKFGSVRRRSEHVIRDTKMPALNQHRVLFYLVTVTSPSRAMYSTSTSARKRSASSLDFTNSSDTEPSPLKRRCRNRPDALARGDTRKCTPYFWTAHFKRADHCLYDKYPQGRASST